MVWYRGCWRRLERFFAARGVEEFSLDVAMAWVDEACGGSSTRSRRARSSRPMSTCSGSPRCWATTRSHGAVLRRYSRSVEQADRGRRRGRRPVPGVAAGRRARRVDGAGVRDGGRGVRRVRWAPAAGWLVCDAGVVEAFVATLAGYQVKTVEQKLCAVRSFLRFASADGLVDAAVLDAVPAVRPGKQARIPSVWDPARWPGSWTRSTGATRAGSGTTRSSC